MSLFDGIRKSNSSDTKIKKPAAYIQGGYNTDIGNLKNGEIGINTSDRTLVVGTATKGSVQPVFVSHPSQLDDLKVYTDKDGFSGIFNTTSTATYNANPKRNNVLPEYLSTAELMFIKDKIEERYSYIKIKNLDELKQAFTRLECFVSDSDISTTMAVFQLESGKYVVIN